MKFLRAFAAACLLVAPLAQAKTLIVVDRDASLFGATTDYRQLVQEQWAVGVSLAKRFIERYNPGSVDVVTADQVWTSLIKDGKVSKTDRGSTTGPYTTYSAVIWASAGTMTPTNNVFHAGCASCSLQTVAKFPTVPQLYLGGGLGVEVGFSFGSTCSTFVSSGGIDPGSQGPDYAEGRMHLPGSAESWPEVTGCNPGLNLSDLASGHIASPGGTVRTLLGVDKSNRTTSGTFGAYRQPPPAWRDSLVSYSSVFADGSEYDRALAPTYGPYIVIRYMDHIATAKPNIYCVWSNHHSTPVGGGDTDPTDTRFQPDPTPIYVALAWLDSLTNHAVLGTNIEPAKLAVQVSGGFRRGVKTGSGGFAPYDSVSVGLACDSIKTALGIPLAVGVDPESIATYASDKALWQRAGAVRFALESNAFIADTSQSGSWNASTGSYTPKIVDPFGRYRTRTFVGATSDTTDTSMASILKRAKGLLAARLGVGFDGLDRVVIASGDDYSPCNWNNGGIDSVALALSAAGFSGVAQNADDSLSLSTAGNHWGYGSNQRYIRGKMFLSHPGFNPRGSTFGSGSVGNGSGQADSSWCIAYTKRSLFGLYQAWWESPQKYGWLKNTSGMALPWMGEPGMHAEISQTSNIHTGVSLVRITASSLGSGDLVASPHMPGFYQLKYLRYQVDAINSFGRTLIQFVYPDGLGPADIRR